MRMTPEHEAELRSYGSLTIDELFVEVDALRRERDALRAELAKLMADAENDQNTIESLRAELAAATKACVVRTGHEVEDLHAHGPTVVCATDFIVSIWQQQEALRSRCAVLAAEVRHLEWTQRAINPETDDPSDGCYVCGGVRAVGHQSGCSIAHALEARDE